ncbi:hypothetical protein DENSPDRAFT_932792 [Dentipellis sp. KUC8613]|nr:hypothetical protein DENSPDRAFT_932792 [Dentipellis sp. KUC8613]
MSQPRRSSGATTKRLLQDRFQKSKSGSSSDKHTKLTDYFVRKTVDSSVPRWAQTPSSQPTPTPTPSRGRAAVTASQRRPSTITKASANSTATRDFDANKKVTASSGHSSQIQQQSQPEPASSSSFPPSSSLTRPKSPVVPKVPAPAETVARPRSSTSSNARSRPASVFDGVEIIRRVPRKSAHTPTSASATAASPSPQPHTAPKHATPTTMPSKRGTVPVLPSKRKLESALADIQQSSEDEPARSTRRNNLAKSKSQQQSTPKASRHKKPRLDSSPGKAALQAEVDGDDDEQLVPSSQSDEQELCVPRPGAGPRDPKEVRKSVQSWLHTTDDGLPAPDYGDLCEDAMDFDPFPEGGIDAGARIPSALDMSFSSSLTPQTSRPSSPSPAPAIATPPPHTGLPSPSSPGQHPLPLPPSSPAALSSPLTAAPTLTHSSSPLTASATAAGRTSPLTVVALTDFRPSTPPPSSPLDVQPLDAKAKTAALVARIRAEAQRAATSGPDDDDDDRARRDIDFAAFESSEDEDEEAGGVWGMTKAASSPPPTYRTRARAGAQSIPTPDLSSPESVKRAPRGRKERVVAIAKTKGKAKGKGRARFDPLDLLLSEKRREERKGSSSAAMRRAEAAGAEREALLRDMVFSEDEDEEEVRDRAGSSSDGEGRKRKASGTGWADEEAARNAARRGMEMRNAGREVREEEAMEEVNAEERERLLGAKEGKAVGKILDGDRVGVGVVKRKVLGVEVWVEADGDAMVVDGGVPVCEFAEEGGVLGLLRDAVTSGNLTRAKMLLDAGLLRTVDLSPKPAVLRWLCESALSTQRTPLSSSAFSFLLNLPPCTSVPLESPLTSKFVSTVLSRLGMKSELLCKIMDNISEAEIHSLSSEARADVLFRLISLVSSFARAHWIAMEEIPDFVMALLFIGIDVDAASQLKRDVMIAIELLCTCLPASESTIESAIAIKVLGYASTLSVSNRSYLLSFFARGREQSMRVARFVAHSLLTEHDGGLSTTTYNALPSLPALLDVLDTNRGSFDVSSETTDYDELFARIDVLSVALSGIEAYTAQDRGSSSGTGTSQLEDSPRRGRERPPLELIKNRLDILHGKIVDTRAAHLDRSRAKAALQRLAMRIYYQRAAVQHSGPKSLIDHWGRGRQSVG